MHQSILSLILASFFWMTSATAYSQSHAPEIPYTHKLHGVERSDPFFWMKDKGSEKVLDHLKNENEWTKKSLSDQETLRNQLFEELKSYIEESNVSAPYKNGQYLYYSKISKGENYRRYYRKSVSGEHPESLILDANELAKGQDYFDLGFWDVSPDGHLLAYAVDYKGDEKYDIHFKDLRNGEAFADPIKEVGNGGEWHSDSTAFFYIIEDEAKRPYQIHLRTFESAIEDVLLFEEKDEQFFLGIYTSQDDRYLFALSSSKETTEASYIPLDLSRREFTLFTDRTTGIRYYPDHSNGEWIVITNENAKDFKVVGIPVDASEKTEVEIRPYREGIRIESVTALKNHFVITEKEKGLERLVIIERSSGEEHTVALPEKVYSIDPANNEEHDTNVYQFGYSSPVRPTTIYNYYLEERTLDPIRESKIPSGHNPEDYTAYRIEATAVDGTSIPITISHSKAIQQDGSAPLYLYGYGSYGETIDPYFIRTWLSYLKRGFVVAIAHTRGGGLLGEDWYQSGKLLNKKNTFSDFIACAEHLLNDNFTSKDRLAISGGSAGGLLIGAVLNERPDLFTAAIAEVPFVDVVTTMLDDSIPLTTFEYEEWGNPNEKAFFDYMLSYSPYDNVSRQSYPATLVTAGYNDPRVPYWEAAKWVAKLKKNNTAEENRIFLKTNLDSGHAGASGRYDYLKEVAFNQAFVLSELNAVSKSKMNPIQQLFDADRSFAKRAQEAGVPEAFFEFAAKDAVLFRSGSQPIVGKDAILQRMKAEPEATLNWEPTHGEISESEDLGFTRGDFTYVSKDGTLKAKGHYVSIWKKEEDGSWKWCLDTGIAGQQNQVK